MNKTKETLKHLIELGDKATQGEWCMAKNDDNELPYVFVGDTPDYWRGTVVARLDYSLKDRDYIVESANARPALKDALAYIEKLEKALNDIKSLNKADNRNDPDYWGNKIVGTAIEALSDEG